MPRAAGLTFRSEESEGRSEDRITTPQKVPVAGKIVGDVFRSPEKN